MNNEENKVQENERFKTKEIKIETTKMVAEFHFIYLLIFSFNLLSGQVNLTLVKDSWNQRTFTN